MKIDFCIIFLFYLCHQGSCQTVTFKIMEESPIDMVIGNIVHLHPSFNKASYFIKSPFLKLSDKGDLMLSSRIDLETICAQHEMCCEEVECILKTTIMAKDKSSDQSESINIHVSVSDKNDNWPKFVKPKQTVNVAENEPIGFYLYLDRALDADATSANRVHQYIFKEPTGTFNLDQSRLPSIGLIVKKPLDYEVKSQYFATLEACDTNKQCNTQALEIHVLDQNDNYPSFSQQEYQIEILENFPVGQQIIAVEAIDKDSDLFNKIIYGFHELSDNNIRNTFIITENTGSIKLQKKLSAKVRQKYKFKVFAADKMAMAFHKAVANIFIKVKDLNDNSPKITSLSGNSKIEINETDPPRELFTLQVTDDDIGVNANVSCQLLQQYINDFRLDAVGNEIYSLSSIRSFDYENEREIKAEIECYDHGSPRNVAHKSLNVHVKDINEFAPRFEKDFQKLKLLENREQGHNILQVSASDRDGSAVLKYSFTGEPNDYFTIDPHTGQIKSGIRRLDREMVERIEINIIVTDAIENPKTGQCTVIIEVLDENDNPPTFIDISGVFNISENLSSYSKVRGRIAATDKDKDEINNKVLFQLQHTFDSQNRRISEPIFKVTESGEILTVKKLDREINHNYTVEIRAFDTGLPMLSAHKNFTIYVEDQNDNDPDWVTPLSSHGGIHTVNITANSPPGYLIIKLQATDPDYGENSNVTYSVMNNNKLLFILNQVTGELRVARLLPIGQFQLFLRASDNGRPPRHNETSLFIFINGDEVATLNMSIIIVLIGITGFISIFLIIAIICVRRRPRYNNTDTMGSQNSFEPPKTSNHHVTGTWGHHTDEGSYYPSGNFLSDNTSVLYFPNEIDSSVPMNTFVSKSNVPHPLITYQNIDNCYYPNMSNSSGYLRNCSTLGNSQTNIVRIPANSNCCDMTSAGSVGRFNEMDDDSADSGKGGSEDDNGLHQMPLLGPHNSFESNGKSRLYTTMPYQNRTLNNGRMGSRARGALPHTINHCPCYILPEDSVVQSIQNNSNCHSSNIRSNSVENLHPMFDKCINSQPFPNSNIPQDYQISKSPTTNNESLPVTSAIESNRV